MSGQSRQQAHTSEYVIAWFGGWWKHEYEVATVEWHEEHAIVNRG